ncbi:AraC family transcriptional regulator [Mucilaginibacter sp. SG564]|uniref:AraC family transcriptional regulator n=1 Tax=Mucilaginibacter sp. SG564 TaxID=2587022 RepID=UPI001554EC47|nr:helix-turn-helix domain-containing protein [Mucilaginibacter sp. SG564]NOW96041.1 AraC-like DNA-binding protein [Mucilaginibacter sp. SG564]
MSKGQKRRNGFTGEKLVNVPLPLLRTIRRKASEVFRIFITEIGYFPKARYHYRERRKGCEDNILIYCTQGKGHYILGNQKYEVHCNEFVFLAATDQYMRYWADAEDPWSIYWVHFTGPNILSFNESLPSGVFNRPLRINFNEAGIEIWKSMYETLDFECSFDSLCKASFCLYHLVATFIFPTNNSKQITEHEASIVTQTINVMWSNINKKLTVEALANGHHISVSHFSYLFRKKTGYPPIDYFNHLKMQRACQLLFGSRDKIKIIASELGYRDPFYFSRLFKQHTGSSPGQYRLQGKNAH